MELTMAAQTDTSPWEIPPTLVDDDSPPSAGVSLPGRAYFSKLGVVRRKPARGDAPPTMSKSCSDKLSLKQCTSLLSSLVSLLVSPKDVYLKSLVLPESQYSETGCTRCFSAQGRMRDVAGMKWPGGYSFSPLNVHTTCVEFAFSRRSVARRTEKSIGSNLAVAWSKHGLEESLVGGVLQGRKQFHLRGSSLVSRRMLWTLLLDVTEPGAVCTDIHKYLGAGTYGGVKDGDLLTSRRRVKADVKGRALQGWLSNDGDSAFGLDRPRS